MTNEHQLFRRRTVLKTIGASGLALGMVGTASAQSPTIYVVTGGSDDELDDAGFSVTRKLADGRVKIVSGPADAESDLTSLNDVEAVTQNFQVDFAEPAIKEDTTEDAVHSDDQWDKHITDAFEAHHTTTGREARIAIVDTGIDDEHQDLGNVDTSDSISFVNGDGTESPHIGDPHSHGTHVAGIAAGTGAEGITGTAPDAELVSIRVLNQYGFGTFADILAGVDYAADLGVDVENLSLGTLPLPPEVNKLGIRAAVQKVMQYAARQGTVSTVAAGNSSENLQQGGQFVLPASVEGIITVSATGPEDDFAFYSNYGTNTIDVGAPGGGRSTREGTEKEDLVLSTLPRNNYGWFAGTSMAAPQVAGLAGLIRDIKPDTNVNQVESDIKHSAELVTGRNSPELGAGRINVLNTVE